MAYIIYEGYAGSSMGGWWGIIYGGLMGYYLANGGIQYVSM